MTKEQIRERADCCLFDEICARQAKTGCPDGICLKFRDAFSLKSRVRREKQAKQLEMEF